MGIRLDGVGRCVYLADLPGGGGVCMPLTWTWMGRVGMGERGGALRLEMGTRKRVVVRSEAAFTGIAVAYLEVREMGLVR